MEKHEIEESTERNAEVKDNNGNYVDADLGTMTITIWKPDGSKDVDAAAMTRDGVGRYSHIYLIGDQPGIYKILIRGVIGGSYVMKTRDEFEAVGEKH